MFDWRWNACRNVVLKVAKKRVIILFWIESTVVCNKSERANLFHFSYTSQDWEDCWERVRFWDWRVIIILPLCKRLPTCATGIKTRYQFSFHSDVRWRSLLAWRDLHLGCSALVAEELGVHTFCWNVSLSCRLLDAVSVLLWRLVVGGVVFWFSHLFTSAISI